jgi:hypothetical protein
MRKSGLRRVRYVVPLGVKHGPTSNMGKSSIFEDEKFVPGTLSPYGRENFTYLPLANKDSISGMAIGEVFR